MKNITRGVCAAVLGASLVSGGTAIAQPANNSNTCSIVYTKDEIPALAAIKLAESMGVPSWRAALASYNAEKAKLEEGLGGSFSLVDANSWPLTEPTREWDTSSVIGEIFSETSSKEASSTGLSSVSPERTGRVPYGALAFAYNANAWRQQVATAGCPGPEARPPAPEETWQVKVPEGSAVAPYQWIGALVGLSIVVGLGAAAMPHIPAWQHQIEQLLQQLQHLAAKFV